MQVYEPGDWVYLFGFSRGAYTARAPAGILRSVGLLSPGAEHLIRYAMTYWRNDHGATSPGGILCAEFEATLARKCPVRFVGVWDTVGSVGYGSELLARSNSFPFTYTNPSVAHHPASTALDRGRAANRHRATTLGVKMEGSVPAVAQFALGVDRRVTGLKKNDLVGIPAEQGVRDLPIVADRVVPAGVVGAVGGDQRGTARAADRVSFDPPKRGCLGVGLSWFPS
jgi:uncharacterized protein (DUF2235 family)